MNHAIPPTPEQADARELLSALVDGEISTAQAAELMHSSRADDSLMRTWVSYQAISHALRSSVVDAASATPLVTTHAIAAPTLVPATPVAANDSVFRWKLVASVAGFAAVGSMVWALVSQSSLERNVLAQRSAPSTSVFAAAGNVQPKAVNATEGAQKQSPDTAPQVMIRDPYLDELLAAHKQFGGASALQQPAGFLRNATFQSGSR